MNADALCPALPTRCLCVVLLFFFVSTNYHSSSPPFFLPSTRLLFTGHLYGVEKIWAYVHYRKQEVPLKMVPELQEFLAKIKSVRQFADPSFAPTPVEGADTLEAPGSSIPMFKTKDKKGSKGRRDSGAADGGRPRAGSGARPRSGSSSRARANSGTFQRPRSGSNARDGSSLKKESSPTKEA